MLRTGCMGNGWQWAALGAVSLALLAGCNRGADSGATSNANAPGSPGTGNDRVSVQPAAPDGPPGGPSGIKGSAPHTGSSGGDTVPGTTGTGTAGASTSPGSGLQGGLGASGTGLTGSFPAGGASAPAMGAGPAGGSTNNTPDSAVGRR